MKAIVTVFPVSISACMPSFNAASVVDLLQFGGDELKMKTVILSSTPHPVEVSGGGCDSSLEM